MDSKSEGNCCVCGKRTTTRCGACETAGFDLFFCSREHQKLIWPVHKLVCGPGKADPFLWPDLTEEEAEEARTSLNLPFFSNFPYKVTLGEALEQYASIPAVDLPLLLHHLANRSSAFSVPPLEEDLRQFLLFHIRVCAANRRSSMQNSPNPNDRCSIERTLQAVAHLAAALLSQTGFPPAEAPGNPLLSPLYHHLLVYKTLSIYHQGSLGEQETVYIRNALAGVERCIAELRKTQPVEALKIFASFSRLFRS